MPHLRDFLSIAKVRLEEELAAKASRLPGYDRMHRRKFVRETLTLELLALAVALRLVLVQGGRWRCEVLTQYGELRFGDEFELAEEASWAEG